jgi:hypothetical protein
MWSPRARVVEQALGVVQGAVVIPHHRPNSDWVSKLRGTVGPEVSILGIAEMTALIWDGDQWRVAGPGDVTVYAQDQPKTYHSRVAVPLERVTLS